MIAQSITAGPNGVTERDCFISFAMTLKFIDFSIVFRSFFGLILIFNKWWI